MSTSMPGKTDDTHASQHVMEETMEDKSNARKDSKGLEKCDATDCTQHWEDAEHLAQNQAEYKKFQEDSRAERSSTTSSSENDRDQGPYADDTGTGANGGLKRGRGANASTPAAKKQKKSNAADEPNGRAGDKNRVPTQGHKVQWKAHPGSVDGEVVEVVYEEKEVEGKKVEASKEDPRIVVKSDGDGEVSVREPQDVYFD